MRRLLAIILLVLLPLAIPAQEVSPETSAADRDFLTALLEDNLSGAGRVVRLAGFAGALSSRATFEALTIADDAGVWLTIHGGAISWNRRALLSGRVEITEMSADWIDLPRTPSTGGVTAEASGFALPVLPVAISIGTLSAGRVTLGAALFGLAAEVSLTGNMHLENGEGAAELAIDRIDGRTGKLTLGASYGNATRQAAIDLLVREGRDGIAVNLLGLPGRPSVELAVHGNGIIDSFQTGLALSTDDQPRLKGTLTTTASERGGASSDRKFSANLEGDITPLLLPEYRDYVGSDVSLAAEGARSSDGQIALSRLVLSSEGLDMSGRLILSPEGLPLEAALTTRLGLVNGDDVPLPIPGEKTYVTSAELMLRYDSGRGDEWRLDGDLNGFRRSGVAIGKVQLDGRGTINLAGQAESDAGRIDGDVSFNASGILVDDAALATAIGPFLSGRTGILWLHGRPLQLPGFDVKGDGFGATGSLAIEGADGGMTVSGEIAAAVADTARFSLLSGRPLGGSAELAVRGGIGLFSGAFDLEGSVNGRSLTVAQAELDRLLAGSSRILASVRRDTDGIEIRSLVASAGTLEAAVSGRIATGSADLSATFDIRDLGALGPAYKGSVSARATLVEADGVRSLALTGTTQDVRVGQPMADVLLAGSSDLKIAAEERDGKIWLQSFTLDSPEISASGTGRLIDGLNNVDLSARLRDSAVLAPGLPGPLTVAGRIAESAGDYRLDLVANGPGATDARIDGTVAATLGRADLRIAGSAQSALVNAFIAPRNLSGPVRFDLALNGPPELASLSGKISADALRLLAPALGIDVQNIAMLAELSGASARVSGSADVLGGGKVRLSGPVSLTSPYEANLEIDLVDVRLRNADVYDTSVSGTISATGPVTGGAMISGAVALSRTELRIASTGLGGEGDIADLIHINEPPDVHRTRVHAGLVESDNGRASAGKPYNLDLRISAPGRIFVRGRGLDAELGGTLQVGGTTDNILPSGQFDLVRGRLDILGKRLTIDEGLVQLQGALLPYIRFAASNQNNGVTTTVLIEGEVSDPEIRFLSVPELPEEEVIAQLLFGRSLSTLSPLQALRLASAVTALAGRGGEDVVSRLRRSFGLDDLDVISEEDGTASVKLGKYLTEKIYSDVTIGPDGKSEINLNLDVRPDLSLRGALESDGGTGIGIYYEKDY